MTKITGIYSCPSEPGKGPNGQWCRGCKNSTEKDEKGYRCKLNNGRIKIYSPACIFWEPR